MAAIAPAPGLRLHPGSPRPYLAMKEGHTVLAMIKATAIHFIPVM
jgi:hypothetical protein